MLTKKDIIFVFYSFIVSVVDAHMSAYLGHTTNVNVVYQSLGLI